MGLMHGGDISSPVTVWHFLSEGTDGAVYHPAVYDAAVVCAERVEEVRMRRHGVAELQGFLFPTGHRMPVTPYVGHDWIAVGDCAQYETPEDAARAGAVLYRFSEIHRPPRLSSGTMVEWVQFTAMATV